MPELKDYRFREPGDERVDLPAHGTGWAVKAAGAGLLAAALVAAGYYAGTLRPTPSTPATATPSPVAATDVPLPPLGGEPAAVTIPPLDESDPVVRTLVGALSSHPRIAAWLATQGLIRNFTVVVENVASGPTPAKHLQTLKPTEGVRVVERNGNLYLDPRSYDRYKPLADAVASLDPAETARLYGTLKPRIEEAHRELGSPDGAFDPVLERAIVKVLETPIRDAPIRVEPHGIGYEFADPDLEALTGAQKQLIRMGPQNARTIQTRLREIALALGIPAERLPAMRREP
jgi:hypothetical protein